MVEHVFISYVREDSKTVDRLANALRQNGVTTWLDRNDIRPGEYWRDAIENAISSGAYFVACFSSNMNKRDQTYMHGELRIAIDRLRTIPNNRIWFIPLLLDDTEIPSHRISGHETLSDIHAIRIYEDWDSSVHSILSSMGITDADMAAARGAHSLFQVHPRRNTNLVKSAISSLERENQQEKYIIGLLRCKDDIARDAYIEVFCNLKPSNREHISLIFSYVNWLGTCNQSDFDEKEILSHLETLSAIGPMASALTTFLLPFCKAPHSGDIRYKATSAIGEVGTVNSGALRVLQMLLRKSPDDQQAGILRAIAEFGAEAHPLSSAILKLVDSDSAGTREAVADAIGFIGLTGKRSVQCLCRLLSDREIDVRKRACRAVKNLTESRSAIPGALLSQVAERLSDSSEIVLLEALEALTEAHPEDEEIAAKAAKLLDSEDPNMVRATIDLLGSMGSVGKPYISEIAKHLRNKDRRAASDASYAIRKILRT